MRAAIKKTRVFYDQTVVHLVVALFSPLVAGIFFLFAYFLKAKNHINVNGEKILYAIAFAVVIALVSPLVMTFLRTHNKGRGPVSISTFIALLTIAGIFHAPLGFAIADVVLETNSRFDDRSPVIQHALVLTSNCWDRSVSRARGSFGTVDWRECDSTVSMGDDVVSLAMDLTSSVGQRVCFSLQPGFFGLAWVRSEESVNCS